MFTRSTFVQLSVLAAGLALAAVPARAQGLVRACVYDMIGTSGITYNISKDYTIQMQKFGGLIQPKAYTDERAAAEDFRTGQCDVLLATAFRTRQFNQISGTLDALGATTILREGKIDMDASYEVINRTAQIFASPAAAKLMVEGNYELGGILALGAAYPMTSDRRINTVEALAGKRIAAFDHDKAQAAMIRRIGAIPVSADVTNFAAKFNNGVVDMIGAPAVAWGPLELHKGVGKNGAVTRFPLLILTYQVILRKDKFPPGFGQKSREYWLQHYEGTKTLIYNAEKSIPAALWMELPPEASLRYALMLREARIDLTNQGLYNRRGLRILKKVRCSINPQDSECSTESELN
ncbi:MAG: hypothetical protein EPO01_07900 [Aquabacterium sp.]|nr:MAG: hypothetical protein EPO01_07900 [Aquabacterium sp.]